MEAYISLSNGTIWQVQSGATSGNLNGAGFNPANTNFPTDLAGSSCTGSTPSVTSATYTFQSSDVGAYLYIKSGTNWIPGWYNITSVTGGAATLNAAIGVVALTINGQGIVTYNSIAGCANASSLSSGTYGVDYSQQNTARLTGTDLTCTANSTTIGITSETFTPVMVGNILHLTAGTGGTPVLSWFEIVSYSSTTTVVLDRTPTDGSNNITAGTFYVGGSGILNGLENTFQAVLPAASIVFIQGNTTYTISGAISTASTNGTSASPIFWIGYNNERGDTCNGTNRPLIAAGANAVEWSQYHNFKNISGTTTAANGIGGSGTYNEFMNCKFLNTSTTSGRYGSTNNNGNYVSINTEFISQNGDGFHITNGTFYSFGNYFHDSNQGIGSNAAVICIESILASCATSAILGTINSTTPQSRYISNTLYGSTAKIGTGINLTAVQSGTNVIINNIITGFSTGVAVGAGNANSNIDYFNNYYNNTTDVSNFLKDKTSLALNPNFTNVSEVTGTTGQGLAGSKFQDTSQNFTTAGVVANQDFLHITSGGSLTAGCYLITAITTTTNPNDTLTLNNNPGTGAASAVYWITIGHNYTVGSNLQNIGFPNFTQNTPATIGYPEIGAVMSNFGASGGGILINPGMTGGCGG